MLDLDIDLVLKWREEREKFEAGLKMLTAKYNVKNIPEHDALLRSYLPSLQADILMILEGWDLREWLVGYTEGQEPKGGSGEG